MISNLLRAFFFVGQNVSNRTKKVEKGTFGGKQGYKCAGNTRKPCFSLVAYSKLVPPCSSSSSSGVSLPGSPC